MNMTGRSELEEAKKAKNLIILKQLPDYVTEWYYSFAASGVTAETLKTYLWNISYFLREINQTPKDIKVSSFDQKMINKYFTSLKSKVNKRTGKPFSSSMMINQWLALRSFFEYLHKADYIDKNFIDNINKPKNHDIERINQNRVLLTKNDFRKIIYKVEEKRGQKVYYKDKLVLLLLMTTGMRVSALVGINLEDIDFKNNKLTVVDKGEKQHVYVLSESVMRAIRLYYNNLRLPTKNNALLITKERKRMSVQMIQRIVAEYSEAALGYKISPHKLRAGFCSILYNETQNAEFVRRAVGHSNIATTQRYIVTDNKEKEEASSIMENIFTKK